MDRRLGTREVILDISIQEVYEQFIRSRKAMYVQPATIRYYERFLKSYVQWLAENGLYTLEEAADSENISTYIASKTEEFAYGGKSRIAPATVHIYARTVRTLIRFAYERGYLKQLPRIKMPILRKKKLPYLTEDGIAKVLSVCKNNRDRAIILVSVASGLRRGEIVALKWKDVDFDQNSIEILEGKGKKYRKVLIDQYTARVLLKYKAELGKEAAPYAPLFQNRDKIGLGAEGLRALYMRLEKETGLDFSAHALRRTFARLCVKSGMDILYIQTLGW